MVGAEATTLLALIETVCKKGWEIETGKIAIGVDNRRVFRNATKDVAKLSEYAQDVGAEIAQIRKLMKEISF